MGKTLERIPRATGSDISQPEALAALPPNREVDLSFNEGPLSKLQRRQKNGSDLTAVSDSTARGTPAGARPARMQTLPNPTENPAIDGPADIHEYLNARWRHDRSVANSTILGQSHAEKRRTELSTVQGASYTVNQYGFRVSSPAGYEPGLAMQHPESAEYHRMCPNKTFQQQCMQLYKNAGYIGPEDSVVFANSFVAVSRLIDLFKQSKPAAMGAIRAAKEVGSGLIAVELSDNSQTEIVQWAMDTIGGTPSAYAVMRLRHATTGQDTTLDETLDNEQVFAREFLNNTLLDLLGAVPPNHPLSAIAKCTASLLGGLQESLRPQLDTPQFRHNPVVANVLHALTKTVSAMPTLIDDSGLLTSAYQAFLSEIQIVLTECKPYNDRDFKSAARSKLELHAGAVLSRLRIQPPVTHLVSSGMDAISTAMYAARKARGVGNISSTAEQRPDYFEVGYLTAPTISSDRGHVFTAPLNVSLTYKQGPDDKVYNWDAGKLVDHLKVRLNSKNIRKLTLPELLDKIKRWKSNTPGLEDFPTVLVLDATLNARDAAGVTDLAKVLNALEDHISDGSLKVILCESYQKYQSLGSGKVMAGAVTLLGAADADTRSIEALLSEAERETAWMQNEDGQLLVHFLTHGAEHALNLSDRAAINAAFVQTVCFPEVEGHEAGFDGYEDNLPFGVILGADAKVAFPGAGDAARELDLLDIAANTLTTLNGFSFPQTTYLAVMADTLRVTFGQEAPHELVEKMYALGWVTKNRLSKVTVGQIVDHIDNIANEIVEATCKNGSNPKYAYAALALLMQRARPNHPEDSAAILEVKAQLNLLRRSSSAESPIARPSTSLKAQLDLSASHATDPLIEALAIMRAVSSEVRTDPNDRNDIVKLRARLTQGSKPIASVEAASKIDSVASADFFANKVASMLRLYALGYGDGNRADDNEVKRISVIFDKMLNAGLPGIAPGTRSAIVRDWLQLNKSVLENGTPAERQRIIRRITGHAERLVPYRDQKAMYFRSIPDTALSACHSQLQKRLVDTLFRPLDIESRVLFARQLVVDKETTKAILCINALEHDVTQAKNGRRPLLHPERISGQAPVGQHALPQLTEAELDSLEDQIAQMSTKLKSAMTQFG
ncbi:hypothetical protein OH764_33960 (plasmid) [Burkholderia sp. M6-3]